jgi:hypothetical protein
MTTRAERHPYSMFRSVLELFHGTTVELRASGEVRGRVAPAATGVTDTITVDKTGADWFASSVGAFDGSPTYAQMIENMRESNRLLAAEYHDVE